MLDLVTLYTPVVASDHNRIRSSSLAMMLESVIIVLSTTIGFMLVEIGCIVSSPKPNEGKRGYSALFAADSNDGGDGRGVDIMSSPTQMREVEASATYVP